ncbi:MAG: DUF4105 domain-containing protein, partial [Myxococcota bacterium]|nr:DUF4105 domain-containing protein [Myxococcota bacterium]
MRAAPSHLACLVFVLGVTWPQPATAGTTEAHLLTMGAGDHLYNRAGHAALMLATTHDDGRLETAVYNYGDTDWDQENFPQKFISGELVFWLTMSGPVGNAIQTYGLGQDRDIFRQKLALTDAQVAELARRLEETAKPENREYGYHHLEQICTTKSRDLLDEILGGVIRATLEPIVDTHTLRHYQRFGSPGLPHLALATGLFLGRSHDIPKDRYYMTFYPPIMRADFQTVMVPSPDGAGEMVPLAGPPDQLYTRRQVDPTLYPSYFASWFGLVLFGVLLLLGGFAIRRGPARPRAAGAFAITAGLVVGLIGLCTTLIIALSRVPEFRDNELWLSLPPTDLILLLPGWAWLRGRPVCPRWLRGYAKIRLVTMVLVELGHLTGLLFQEPAVLRLPGHAIAIVLLVVSWQMLHGEAGTLRPLDHETARAGWLARFVGRCVIVWTGWRYEGAPPDQKKFVIIAAPHTSNWDLVHMLAGAWTAGVSLSWMGKLSLFKPPFGWVLLAMGGVPIDRSRPLGTVGQIAETFAKADRLALAIPPSGTRGYRDHWKSGFYHIAREAGVPILCCSCDYARNVTAIGAVVHPTGDVRVDMDAVRDFYADVGGKFPDRVSRMKLNEESG